MTKRMLIDATHAEETRVVVLDGNRLEDFDVETSTKRQLKGNIYLAKVVRVEPSLQAAFVEYGGNRHGFLAFSEIHPDYYQIPVADRQRLIDQEVEEAQREEEEVDRELAGGPQAWTPPEPPPMATDETGEPSVEPGAGEYAPATEMLRDGPWEQEAHQSPHDDAALSGFGDSVTGGAETTTAADDAAVPADATFLFGGLGDSVTGAAAIASHDTTPQPAEYVSFPADSFAAGVPAADIPAEAAPSPDATTALAPVEAPPTDPAPESPAAGPASPEPVNGPSDQDVSGHVASEHDGSEAGTSEHVAPAHSVSQHSASDPAPPEHHTPEEGEEPQPPARRAQPMIIEPDTLSGPVETGTADDDSDTFTLPGPQDAAAEADTEHDPDLADDYSESIPEAPPPETVGGEPDGADEQRERRVPSRHLRNYKIQEVIRRRQILLVQVVKEERGTKGAALTTYLSLAGRFSVLMPNSPRGGGISRKITSATDRRRLKEVISELEMPKGMGLIVRTAGANRPKPEIKRDCEYLLRLWDDIREHTLKSVAPALIYEEASLIKRAIRDVYSRDIDEILVDGEEGWRAAHEFMRMLMPSHAKKVQLWRDPSQPLFAKYQVEAQLDAMLLPTVQLRSGGYLVINQTEALVAIDVNSGRSTRERNVEETALRTNLEASDEVARQLRLRDLAGLVVIDFIDMESKKHNAMVERRLTEGLKNDRARIQVGHISHFGLMEMSRQRLRPSLAEASFILCPHCGGTGHVRSTENAAIHVLRGIEDEGSKRRAAEIAVYAAMPIALYILNHKRDRLGEIELRYAMRVTIHGDDTQVASQFRIERMRPQVARDDALGAITPDAPQVALPAPRFEPEEAEPILVEDETDLDEAGGGDEAGAEDNAADEAGGEAAQAEGAAEQAEHRRRRRRRRRGGRREDGTQSPGADAAEGDALVEAEPAQPPEQIREEPEIAAADEDPAAAEMHIEGVPEHAEPGGEDDARRRRGRRGGRRRRREPGEAEGSPFADPGAEQPDLPVYLGPTPANPFGGQAFDIFDVLEQAEASAAMRQEPVESAMPQMPPDPEEVLAGPAVWASFSEPVAPAPSAGSGAPAAPEELEGRAESAAPVPSPEPGVPSAPPEPEEMAAPFEPEAAAAPLEPEAAAAPSRAEMSATSSAQEVTLPAQEATSSAQEAILPAQEATSSAQEATSSAQEATSSAQEAILPAQEATSSAQEVTLPAPEATSFAQAIVNATAPEPVPTESMGDPAVAEPAPADAAAPPGSALEPMQLEVANDVAPEPAIRPVIIGSGEEPAQKKRGWWRR